MFQPSQDNVRGFFVEARRKRLDALPLTPLETIAADWIEGHPEYAGDLADAEAARQARYGDESGRENPFLHLSMHLSISERSLYKALRDSATAASTGKHSATAA